jgi:hypothetical protein
MKFVTKYPSILMAGRGGTYKLWSSVYDEVRKRQYFIYAIFVHLIYFGDTFVFVYAVHWKLNITVVILYCWHLGAE